MSEEQQNTTVQVDANTQQNTANDSQEKQLEQLKLDNQVLKVWGQLLKNMEEKLNKTTSFQAIDVNSRGFIDVQDFTTYIKDIKIEGLQSQTDQIFKLINEDGEEGKIVQQQWSDAWLQQSQRQYENDHKIQMITQKLDIFKALQTPAKQGQKLEDSKLSSKYQSMVDTIKNSSSLTDITQMFSSVQTSSPFSRSNNKDRELAAPQSTIIFDLRKDKIQTKNQDVNFSKYRTPKKDMGDYESSMGRPSFLSRDEKIIQVQKSPQMPSSLLPMNGRSPQLGLSKFQIHPQMSTKVEKQMNINVETTNQGRQVNKTSRRKEDLNTFMVKVGLGKYDAPRVTVDLGVQAKYSKNPDIERMKNLINGKETIRQQQEVKKTSSLNDFFNDPHFTKKSKIETRERGISQSASQESFSLNDQSLKNYTMKLIHQHKFVQNQPTMQPQSPLKRKTSLTPSYLVRNS